MPSPRLLFGLIVVGAPARAAPYDVVKPAWFDWREIVASANVPGFAGGSGPNGASDRLPDVDAYLVGNIFVDRPFGPEVLVPVPLPGGPLVVPAHDDLFTRFLTTEFDGFGFWVLAGPAATMATVLTRPVSPGNNIAGGPLAWAVFEGGAFQPLTSAARVEAGLAAGLLQLNPAGWGGVGRLSVPAPATLALFGLGAAAIVATRRRAGR